MCFHNDPEQPEEGTELRELTQAAFDGIVASIVAGRLNNLTLVYDRLDEWLVGANRSEMVQLIVGSLAGKNPFADLVRDLAWAEAKERGQRAYKSIVSSSKDMAGDRSIAAHVERVA